MSNKCRPRSLRPADAATFRPGLTDIEKKERHRQAAARYYARHPEAREKNRLSMQRHRYIFKKRAAIKAYRRQWDPPKKTPGKGTVPAHATGHSHFQDIRAATTASGNDDPAYAQLRLQAESSAVPTVDESAVRTPPTAQEQTAIEALHQLGAHFGGSQDSVLAMANLLSSDGDSSADSNLAGEIPVAVALLRVSRLNEGPLTRPTPEERRRWCRTDFEFKGDYLPYREWRFIHTWRWRIYLKSARDDSDTEYDSE
ncbi:hypothetical protein C8R47DRAFT_1083773 [Mycena vitilis]|nr:hypothetical protein C8R47DRAFT_1083773 [Mycena vitilis]